MLLEENVAQESWGLHHCRYLRHWASPLLPSLLQKAGAATVMGSEPRRRRAAVYGRLHRGRRVAPPAVGEMARPLPTAFPCERVEDSCTHRRTGS